MGRPKVGPLRIHPIDSKNCTGVPEDNSHLVAKDGDSETNLRE